MTADRRAELQRYVLDIENVFAHEPISSLNCRLLITLLEEAYDLTLECDRLREQLTAIGRKAFWASRDQPLPDDAVRKFDRRP